MGRDRIHFLPVSNRVKVQVAPLDHLNRVFLQKADKGVDFPGCVAESGTIQVVNGGKFFIRQRYINAFEDICKIVAFGPEICIVAVSPHTVHADTNAVQSGIQ